MDYPKKYTQAFAATGDYNVIPDSPTEPGQGFASFAEGFPPELSQPFSQSGKAVKRLDFNGILNKITQFQIYQQSGGMFKYDATVDYDPPAIIYTNGKFYSCVKENGPSSVVMSPTDDSRGTYWTEVLDSTDLAPLWSSINNKSNVGHTHTSSDIIGGIGGTISSYSSGSSSFYVKFTNGFIIQGGRLTTLNTPSDVGQTVSLPTAFATNNFTVAMTSLGSYWSKRYIRKATINSRSSVSFYDCMSGAGTWLAYGF